MLIHVQYKLNNNYDYVKDRMLQVLIESGGIARFRRSSGWVTVGVDPIRKVDREYLYTSNEFKKKT